jgi:hypothetical protein
MRPLLLQLLLLLLLSTLSLSAVSIASLSLREPLRGDLSSSSSFSSPPSYSSCRHVPGLDFDDDGWSAPGSTPDDCCQRCIASTTGCAAVVYAQGVCYFKNSTFAPRQGKTGAIACTPEAALPSASQLKSRLGATHWNGCYNRRSGRPPSLFLPISLSLQSSPFTFFALLLSVDCSLYLFLSFSFARIQ